MHLTKTERKYKKKLFRHINVKKRSKQKELTAVIAESPVYKRGGFKKVYFSVKNYPTTLKNLTNVMNSVVIAVRAIGKSMMELASSLLKQATKNDDSLPAVTVDKVSIKDTPFTQCIVEDIVNKKERI